MPPLLHNMAELGLSFDEVDGVFITHLHRDHIGGVNAERSGVIRFGEHTPNLDEKPLFAPEMIAYQGMRSIKLTEPGKLFQGIATTGPISRSLVMGRIKEQAMVVNVAGHGLVVVVGCGHQTIPRLLERIEHSFDEPLYGVVGDLHFPVPEGRLRILGLDAQRIFASGDGIFSPLTMEDAKAELLMLDDVNVLALGGHDTSDEMIDWAQNHFGDRYHSVEVGRPIIIGAE